MSDAERNVRQQRVLLWLADEADQLTFRQALGELDALGLMCDSMQSLCSEADNGAAILVFDADAAGPDDTAQLEWLLQQQPPWSNLAVLAICNEPAGCDPGLISLEPHLQWVERPHTADGVRSRLAATLRDRARQYELGSQWLARQNDLTRWQSAQTLADFLDRSAVPLQWVNLDGTLLRANQAQLDLLGYQREQYVGRHICYFHVDRSRIDDLLARVAQGETVNGFESCVRRQDGSLIDVAIDANALWEDGRHVYTLCFVRDISAQKQAQQALQQSRQRLDLIIDSAKLGLWYSDLPIHRMVWNARCKEHFGLPPDAEVTIEAFYERIHPDDRQGTQQKIDESIRNGTVFNTEYRTVSPEGQIRWIRAIGRCTYDKANQPRQFDGITVDISVQKNAQEQLQENDRRKDEFLAMLGHELRNPLAALSNALTLLELPDLTPTESLEAREIVGRQLQNMTRLIDDLLDIARVARGKITLNLEPIDLVEIVYGALGALEVLIKTKGHHLELRVAEGPIQVLGDATRLEQIVTNLIHNAAKYTQDGGHIVVSLDRDRERSEAVLSVRDNGLGMTPDTLERAFELFAQADRSLDRSEGGLGIGLTTVKSLVELHGGLVTAASPGPGLGSEFTVRFRALTDTENGSSDEGEDPTHIFQHTTEPPRVLVVDDNVDAAHSMLLLLRNWGYPVQAAHDGPSALVAARQYQPQIVLLDIGLPGMDGYQVARRLREEIGSDLVLVALTGYGRNEDRQRAAAAGFDQHVTKPIRPSALQGLLANLERARQV